jgi:hypothetical protein
MDDKNFIPGTPASSVEKTFFKFSAVARRLGNAATGAVSVASTALTLKRINEARAALDVLELATRAAAEQDRTLRSADKVANAKLDRGMVSHLIKNPSEIARAEKLGGPAAQAAQLAKAALNIETPAAVAEVPVVVPIRKGLAWGLGRKAA